MGNGVIMKRLTIISFIVFIFALFTSAQKIPKEQVSCKRIYGDGTTYCAFTTFVKAKDTYYLAFREADTHVSDGDYGKIRILKSNDGDKWDLLQTLSKDQTDLRDPNLSVMPNGIVLLLCGARRKQEMGKYQTTSEYSILTDTSFTNLIPVNYPLETTTGWIWKLTWHKGIGYGGCYQGGNRIDIVETLDGKNYKYLTTLKLFGKSYETKILFDDNDNMMAFVRREPGIKGMMGLSRPPYFDWEWTELPIYLAGQELMIVESKLLCVSRTQYNIGAKTTLWWGGLDGDFSWSYTLPSMSKIGSDTGYVGIIDNDTCLWISYYSTMKASKPSIYLAKVNKSYVGIKGQN